MLKSGVLLVSCLISLASCQLPYNKLMVVGGWPDAAYANVEVIDLDNPDATCAAVPDYVGAGAGSFGTTISGAIFVCGGTYGFNISVTHSDLCFSLDNSTGSLEWVPASSLSQTRAFAASVQLSETEWWLSGGRDESSLLDTSEIWTTESGGTPAISLPDARVQHHIVAIENEQFVLVGGDRITSKAWLYDRASNEWSQLPDVPDANAGFQGGLVKYPDGRREVVIAGGWNHNACYGLDLDTFAWNRLPSPPTLLYYGRNVQYGDSFLIVSGAQEGVNYSKSIYTFDVNAEDWIELPQKLQNGRELFTAFLIPNDAVQCQ